MRTQLRIFSLNNDAVKVDAPKNDVVLQNLRKAARNRFKEKVDQIINNIKVEKFGKDDEAKVVDFASTTNKLLQKSSIYAVSQLGHSQNQCRKIIWAVILSLGLLGCGYQLYRFIALYLQYPVIINLQVERKWILDFPAVTVCNLNRMNSKYQHCMNPDVNISHCLRQKQVLFKTNVAISERRSILSCSTILSGKNDKGKDLMMDFLMKYSAMDTSKQIAFGYQAKDLIEHCAFNGQTCSPNQFERFQSLQYGNCFTFNSVKRSHNRPLTETQVGYRGGLELTLNMDHKNYLSVSHVIGARVVIHHPLEEPNPDGGGIDISPGFETSIALEQTITRRLRSPYRDHCEDYKIGNEPYNESQDACVRNCIQRRNFDACGCVDPTLSLVNDIKHCNMTLRTDACCLDDVLNGIIAGRDFCKCPLPCISTKYMSQLSMTKWPSEAYFFRGKSILHEEDMSQLQNTRRSKSKLKIYYATLTQKIFEQKAKFEKSEIFSHLGGELGLWLGLSLMAIFELIETVVYLGKHFLSRVKK